MTNLAAQAPAGLNRLMTPLVILCIAQFMIQLDFTIVNVALEPIQSDLGFSAGGLQWVVTGYGLTFGSLLIFGGRLGDHIGRRRLFLIGLGIFGVASAVCALAGSPAPLVAARIVQGVGAALVAPMVLAILTGVYTDGAAQARALGIWTASMAGGAMSGIVLGGLLTDAFGWRAAFLVNVPIILLLLPLARRVLPESRPEHARGLDIPGTACITLALAALIFGMSSGEERGFGSAITIAALAAAVLFAAAFFAVERRASDPAVPLAFLAAPVRRTSALVLLLVSGVTVAYVYFVALFLRGVLEMSGSTTSIAFIPGPVGTFIFSLFITRHLIARFGLKTVLLAGIVMLGVGQLWLSAIASDSSYWTAVLPALILTGCSSGLVVPAVAAGVAAGATPRERGLVGGLVPTSQQVGGAIGVAVLATIAASVSASHGGDLATGYGRGFLVSVFVLAALALLVAVTSFRPPESAPH
ncbi:unannotated protein [freshwater metagenome]|uniref:Unannotated protein n=1 Tax=freshwater metagenome TaxID=449393 RepID=A0A6J7J4D6_9ZZZZ|nr:MFS transporter [Actinomycetota bacterium]